jgi:hypothetical protein
VPISGGWGGNKMLLFVRFEMRLQSEMHVGCGYSERRRLFG